MRRALGVLVLGLLLVLFCLAIGGQAAGTQRIADYDLAITELQARILRMESRFERLAQEQSALVWCVSNTPRDIYKCMQMEEHPMKANNAENETNEYKIGDIVELTETAVWPSKYYIITQKLTDADEEASKYHYVNLETGSRRNGGYVIFSDLIDQDRPNGKVTYIELGAKS